MHFIAGAAISANIGVLIFLLFIIPFSIVLYITDPYTDSPSYIFDVTNGVFTIQTNEKRILKGHLAGITWTQDFNDNKDVQHLIDDARRDRVLHHYDEEQQTFKIWYISTPDAEEKILNEEIIKVCCQ